METYTMSSEQREASMNRRVISKSDDEIQEEMDRNNMGYTWRRGYPSLTVYPLRTDAQSEAYCETFTKPQLDDLIEHAENVMKAQRVREYEVMTCLRLPKHIAYDPSVDKKPYLTLLCGIDFGENDAAQIDRYIIQIYQSLLRNPAFLNVKIEVIDLDCVDGPFTFAIQPADTTVMSEYLTIYEEIVERLRKNGVKYLCMETVRRGLSKKYEDCPATIVVGTPAAYDMSVHKGVVSEIRSWLFANDHQFEVELAFSETLLNTRPQYEPTTLVHESSYGNTVYTGASIGDDQKGSSGTLGGVLTLRGMRKRTLGREVRCALTNWHVVQDQHLDACTCF
jgi:hypothetical protein